MMKCGCKVFCSLHAAAPEMLQALKEAVDLISDEYCSHIGEKGNCGPEIEECYASAQLKAIAHAEGKE